MSNTSAIFGKKLVPYADIKTMLAMKGKKQRVKVSHVPSTINQNEDLYVDLPNMWQNDVIFPGTLKILFDLELRVRIRSALSLAISVRV